MKDAKDRQIEQQEKRIAELEAQLTQQQERGDAYFKRAEAAERDAAYHTANSKQRDTAIARQNQDIEDLQEQLRTSTIDAARMMKVIEDQRAVLGEQRMSVEEEMARDFTVVLLGGAWELASKKATVNAAVDLARELLKKTRANTGGPKEFFQAEERKILKQWLDLWNEVGKADEPMHEGRLAFMAMDLVRETKAVLE